MADAYALGPPRVGPYLHDGRAAILADAIGKHGGEAHDTVRRYSALSVVQKFQLDTFLKTLTAPARPAELASRSLVARREWAADYDRTEAEDRALRSERLAAAERARKLAEQLQIEKE